MTVGGKHGKPIAGFPPFPPPLEIPQQRRDSHIPTASTTGSHLSGQAQNPCPNPQTPGWARINCRSGPSPVAKGNGSIPSLATYPKYQITRHLRVSLCAVNPLKVHPWSPAGVQTRLRPPKLPRDTGRQPLPTVRHSFLVSWESRDRCATQNAFVVVREDNFSFPI